MNGLRWSFAAACLLLSPSMESCARTSPLPTVPADAVALVPPPAYSLWWRLTEECSGRIGDLNRITWYVVPSAQHLLINERPVDGYWSGDTIVLADSAKLTGSLVRHEMLHALTGDSRSDHPREMFLERCGGIVACDERCIQDAGPPAAGASALQVPAESLVIDARTVPESPSHANFGGSFALIVTARNPGAQRVHIALQEVGVHGATIGFGFRLKGNSSFLSSNAWESDTAIATFEPGASRSYAFDLEVQGEHPGIGIPPGPTEVVGRFADHEMQVPWRFMITP